jgi:ABC-2 type transport system permease protein
MWRSTIRLLRLNLQRFRNRFKHHSLRRKIGMAFSYGVVLAGGVFIGFASWGFVNLFKIDEVQRGLLLSGMAVEVETLLLGLPTLILSAAFLMGLLANISILLQTLYLAGDMEFLLSAPIPARAVFLSKLLQAIAPVIVLLLVFAGPALFGLGYGQGYNLAYFLAVPAFLIILVISGAGLAALIIMLLVRIVSPRRAAEAIALVGGTAAFLCSQSGQLMVGGNRNIFAGDRFAGLAASAVEMTTAWNPLSWGGRALLALADADWLTAGLFSGGTLVLGVVVFGVTLTVAERMYLSGWSRISVGGSGKKRTRRARRRERAGRRTRPAWLPVQVAALLVKDFRLFRRDLRNLSQLILPVVMAVIWAITFSGSDTSDPELFSEIQGGFGLLMGVMMAWGFSLRLGMGAFSLEGTSWWIIKTAPVRRGSLLAAKYLLTFAPPAVLGSLFVTILALFSGRPPGGLLLDILIVVLVLAGMSGLTLSFGIWRAKFDWKDPREIQGGGSSGCLVSLLSMAVIFFLLGIFRGLPLLLTAFAEVPQPWAALAGIGLGALVCAALGIIPLVLSTSRLDTLGEDN